MTRGLQYVALMLLMTLATTNLSGQITVKTRNLGLDQGLSQNMVTCINRDNRGFLWIGTRDGLNRYDGYEFKVFKPDPADEFSICDNIIYSLLEDRKGRFWVGTERGLCLFDYRTERFSVFRKDREGTDIGLPMVSSLLEDHEGNIWIGTRVNGLIVLDAVTGKLRNFDLSSVKEEDQILHIQTLAEDKKQRIWLGSSGSLYYFDPKKAGIHQIPIPGDLGVRSSITDSRGHVWIGTGKRLYRFVPETAEMVSYNLGRGNHLNGTFDSLCEKDGRLWIGRHTGLYHISLDRDPNDKSPVERVFSDPPLSGVGALFVDPVGLLWMGSGGMGLFCLDTNRPFNYFGASVDPGRPYIYSIALTSSGNLWMGTNKGIQVWNQEQGELYDLKARDGFPNFRTGTIVEMGDGSVWASGEWGLARYKDFYPFEYCLFPLVGDETEPDFNVGTLFPNRDGTRLWVGTEHSLIDIDPVLGSSTRVLDLSIQVGTRSQSQLQSIIWDNHWQGLWLGFDGGGLGHFEPDTGAFKSYTHDPTEPDSLSNNRAICLYQDVEGQLWIGTRGGGLNCLNPATGHFVRFREKDGLPNDTVYSILADSMGFLWLSTNNGLARLDPRTGRFEHFTTEDGIQGREFNTGARFQDREGLLYFGGTNGITLFNPLEMHANTYPPPVVITDFQLFGKPASLRTFEPGAPAQLITTVDKMTLSHRENVFTFQFSALDFSAPNKNRYAYKLEGFNTQWIETSSRARSATYTNLDSGSYRFRVKASNGDGIWNEEGISLLIVIKPPIWRTWWAYGLYILVLTALVFAYLYKNQRKGQLLARLVEARTSELHEKNQALDAGLQELQTLNHIAQAINREVEFDKIVAILLSQARVLFRECDEVLLLHLDSHVGQFHLIDSARTEITNQARAHLSLADVNLFLGCEVSETRGVWLTFNTSDQFSSRGLPVFSLAVVMTLIHQERLAGLLILGSYRDLNPPDETIMNRLRRFSEYAVTAVSRARIIRDLINTQHALLEAAHRSGMAENATQILHQMGNLFNTIQTDAQLILESATRRTWHERLDRVVELLATEEHLPDPGNQSGSDWKTLVSAIAKISRQLHAHNDKLVALAQDLEHGMQAARGLLADQQRFTGARLVLEKRDLNQVVREVLELEYLSLKHQHIKVIKEWRDLKPVLVDNGKLRLTLLSLLDSARSAILSRTRPEPPTIWISTGMRAREVFLEMEDNGPGLETDELVTIFRQGTRAAMEGRREGLHYAANAIQEMDGRIEVSNRAGQEGLKVTIFFTALAEEPISADLLN